MKDRTRPHRGRNERLDERPRPRENARPENRRDERPQSAGNSNTGQIYGLLPVIEALRGNARRIEKILIAEGSREHRLNQVFELARDAGVRIERTSRESLARITGPETNHQGIVAFASSADYVPIGDLLDGAGLSALFVLLDGIEDPRNLGAVLRTAECAGVDGVIIPERRAVGLTDTVAKSSAGAIEYVKVAKAANLNRVIDDLK